MKFLIIDADPSMVEVITIALELYWPAARVFSAPDGARGLEVFRREAPDLTLLDSNLLRTGGWEMLRQARAESQAPMIILTGRGDEPARVRGQALGANDCLPKPFSHLELFARVTMVLQRAASPTSAA